MLIIILLSPVNFQVLLDLPSHGARMDEHIDLESSIEVIVNITKQYAPPFGAAKYVSMCDYIFVAGSPAGLL